MLRTGHVGPVRWLVVGLLLQRLAGMPSGPRDLWAAASSDPAFPLVGGTTCRLVGAEETRALLEQRDDFVQRLSPFDRASRLKQDREVTEAEYLTFAGQSARSWTANDRLRVEDALQKLGPRLAALGFRLPLPAEIRLARTTGLEEGGAPYTRTNAVILPGASLTDSAADLAKLLAHELFHILTRHRPQLRSPLYQAIGFYPCPEVRLPEELAPRRITNPDAPRFDHYIRLTWQGQPVAAVPVLYSRQRRYDPRQGGEFFAYLQFRFLLFQPPSTAGPLTPLLTHGQPTLTELDPLAGFHEQVGQNTRYLIHPEEILADNFALLLEDRRDVPSPEVLTRLRQALSTAAETSSAGLESPTAAPAPAETEVNAGPTASRWQEEMSSFAAGDQTHPPPPGAIVFLGSSSIRLWKTLAEDFPDFPTVNRGFGGSHVADSLAWRSALIDPCAPRQIVLYAGDNDLAAGRTPEQVSQDYAALVRSVHARFPDCHFAYIAIKPSPARWHLAAEVDRANRLISEFSRTDPRLRFIDVFHAMLGREARPRMELFGSDGLHLNAEGYRLWRDLICPHLRPAPEAHRPVHSAS